MLSAVVTCAQDYASWVPGRRVSVLLKGIIGLKN